MALFYLENRTFSPWGGWSICSTDHACGGYEGTKTRNRACIEEKDQCYWTPCPVGENIYKETGRCNSRKCVPIDGGWSVWLEWTKCTRACGGGVRTRIQKCNSPIPRNGGTLCIISKGPKEGARVPTEEEFCNTEACSGNWESNWDLTV